MNILKENRFVFSILFSLLISNTLMASEVIDSLKNEMIETEDLEQRAERCKYIGDQFYPISQDSILTYYQLSSEYAKETPTKSDDINILRGYGYYHTNLTNQYQKAIDYYYEALEFSQQGDDAKNSAMVKNDLGIVFWKKGEYQKAIINHFEANEIAESLDDADLSMRTLLSLGIIHNEGKRNEEAKEFYLQALPLAEEVGHQRAVAMLLNNLGKVYRDLTQYDLAQTYFEKALKAFENQNNIYWQGLSHYNLGYNFFLKGEYKKAIDAYDRALLLNEKNQEKDRTVMILTGLAETCQLAEREDKAVEYAHKGLDILKDLDTKLYHSTLNRVLAISYEKQKNFKKSSLYFQKNIEKDNQEHELAKMEALYINQRKTAEINKLQLQHSETLIKRQKTLAWLISSIVLLVLSIFITRMLYYRMKIREMEKYDALRNKLTIDLHDNVGSSLNQIKMLASKLKLKQNKQSEIPQKNNTEVSRIKSISNDLISNMYDLIWSIDKDKEQIEDLLNHMRDHASNIFSPLELPFKMKINADEKVLKGMIDAELKNNIYSVYREAINNIVKHTRPELVNINIDLVNNRLNLKIENDKKNILENQLSNKKGLQSMKERAKTINGKLIIKDNPNNFIVNLQVNI